MIYDGESIQNYYYQLILRKKEKLTMAKAIQKQYNQSFLGSVEERIHQ